jgi:uncharacterized protein YkwD
MIRLFVLAAIAAGLSILQVHAAPPTLTPEPGYDAPPQDGHRAAAPTATARTATAPAATTPAASSQKPPHTPDYAGAISAYRRAHGLPAVKSDLRLAGVALRQAQAMAQSGNVSHSAGASFSTRAASLRKRLAAENIGAGFLSFPEMLKQWENSRGHRENLLMVGARRVGVASVANPASPYRKFWAMVITD